MKALILNINFIFFILHLFGQGEINVKNYGAKGNGKTDDTKAIQSAINAASPSIKTIIYFPAGVYNISSFTTTGNYLENYSILLHSKLDIKGDGDKSVIRVGDHIFDKSDTNANAHLFYGRQISNISFSYLMIDLNGANNLVPPNVIKNHSAIFTAHGSNYYLHDITIKNCSGTNMINILGSGKKLIIKNCKFLNGGNYVGTLIPNKNQYDYSFIYTEWDSTVVKDNLIEQENIDIGLGNNSGGLELHGSGSSAVDNTFKGCWPCIFISSSKKTGLQNISIQNNKMIDCIIGINFWLNLPMENITISNNIISLTAPRSSKRNLCIGIFVPNGNAKEYSNRLANGAPLTNLHITGNTITAESMPALSAGMMLHSLQRSYILNNNISEMNYSGIVLMGSKWGMDSLDVQNNTFSDFRPNPDKKAAPGYIVITDTYSKTVNAAPGLKNIIFTRNKFLRTKPSIKGENFAGAFINVPSNNLKEITFTNNYYSVDSEKKPVIVKN